jgi:hypothetical protein
VNDEVHTDKITLALRIFTIDRNFLDAFTSEFVFKENAEAG